MKPSVRKVFDALLDREEHSITELREMTGVQNVHSAVAEIRNVHRAEVLTRINDEEETTYRLTATRFEEMPARPNTFLEHFKIPKAKKPKVKKHNIERSEEVHTLILTDTHFGAKSEDCNLEVTKERLQYVTEEAFRHAMMRDVSPKRLEMDLIGDLIHGQNIYKNQAWETDGTIVQQVEAAVVNFGMIAQAALEVYEEVVINVVPGNHGRTSHYDHEMSNWDIVVGLALKYHLSGIPRITVNVADDFFIIREKLGHTFLLVHGHQGRSASGFLNVIPKWRGNSRIGWFDVVECGHFHNWRITKADDIRVIQNGTLQTGGQYGISNYGSPEDAIMTFFATTRENAIEWIIPLAVPR